MDKCPYCGAETRPGDNFCLNCGNRLLSASSSSSPQQAQPVMGEATLAAPDDWAAAVQGLGSSGGWGDDGGKTIAASDADPTVFSAEPAAPTAPAAQATLDKAEQSARFILHSENGEVIQEYPLDKPEITIGRAPNSDILLSKDKLTSRRHATVRYENGQYVLRDERSANGTFVNGQQIEEMVPRVLQEGDHVGIGEHELIFRTSQAPAAGVEDMPTIAVPYDSAGAEFTFRTRDDDMATIAASDEFGTRTMDQDVEVQAPPSTPRPEPALVNGATPTILPEPAVQSAPEPRVPSTPLPAVSVPVASSSASSPAPVSESSSAASANSSRSSTSSDASVTFNRLTSLPLPTLPDMTALMAALSTLDGQVMSLQEQLNATQDALRNHETEISQTTSQLRTGIRHVSERMDNTIADVARSRETLAWAELLQLVEDVMNNPRDVEYLTKLARKARELNKIFQIHQNVLNTMAECNSLLRGMIGEEK